MTALWVILGIGFLLALASGMSKNHSRKSGASGSAVRIDRPHVIEQDDYECSVCHRHFQKDLMICPYCGIRFTGRMEDSTEWDEEEDELEAWDEEAEG